MDRHRFDAGPDPDPTFYFDADTHPGPDATPSFTFVAKSEFLFFTHSSTSLHCFMMMTFIFLVIVIGVIIFNILDSVWKTPNSSFYSHIVANYWQPSHAVNLQLFSRILIIKQIINKKMRVQIILCWYTVIVHETYDTDYSIFLFHYWCFLSVTLKMFFIKCS